ncbi:MAG: TetR/AcrR family transcriptional regulator [Chloroflexota bacterium]|nr:TetR/AcrR family transcriptional regulator [Chloroflexota bacterium]
MMARPIEFDRTKALDAAMQVFWCQGYTATSTQDLMQAMGIKPGSLYNAFRDKHTLYLEALERYQETVGSCVFEPLMKPNAGSEAIKQVFADLVNQEVSDPQHRGCFMLNATLELASHDNAVRELAEQAQKRGQNAFYAALLNAQSIGAIDQHHDLEQVAAYLVSLIYGVRSAAKARPEHTYLSQIVHVGLSILK